MKTNPFSHNTSAALLARLVICGVILAMLAAPRPAIAQDASGSPPPLAGEENETLPCFDGRLRIRDLAQADPYMAEGLEHVMTAGKRWEPDATLFSLRLGCPLLETGFQLEGTLFSRTAQAFYTTGTGEVRASNAEPGTIPIFHIDDGVQVSFVYNSLVQAGFDEHALLGAAGGVTIQPNTDNQPFGPPTAPKGDVYYHVSILQRGEVIDVWVASKDGNVYRYTSS